jgi:hypothetical protein
MQKPSLNIELDLRTRHTEFSPRLDIHDFYHVKAAMRGPRLVFNNASRE